MSPPDDREHILRRRAAFLAALVSASVASSACGKANPFVCLSPEPLPPKDAGSPSPSAESSQSAGAMARTPPEVVPTNSAPLPVDSTPRPCLTVLPPSPPPPSPAVCLSKMVPSKNR